MSNLNYKTRGMVSPQGKPRVYFSSHPDDFSSYFKDVSDSILKCQNCAIYYMEKADQDKIIKGNSDAEPILKKPISEMERNHQENLEQMQLFVIPVTWKLLTTSNYVMDLEYPFAISHHIPVLPIIQERGLLRVFEEKFGQMQFLDATVEDETAIKFEEKLRNYLEKILIGDEMAEKVRAAFDAYVFLSYRKKDRKYAQQLMKLIHKNEFCRDIAIWYDEFLTPGENFNNSIRDALKKSDLFVMSVTPNLVNENNYIMTTEYPLAVQERKFIIPVEMVSTDKTKLAEKYQGIPKCVEVCDKENLSEVLMDVDVIKRLIFQEKNNSAEHKFFIGLAYLRGIDVEVDFERASKLITASAENGLLEAVDMLISMHRFGIGVELNYDTMIQWQKKKILLLEQDYFTENTVEHLDVLVQEILKCGDYYIEISSFSSALQMYKKAEEYLKSSESLNTSDVLKRNLSMTFYRVADLLKKNGDMAEAEQYINRGHDIIKLLTDKTTEKQIRQNLSASYLTWGDLYNHKSKGDLQKAREYYEKCCEIRESNAGNDGSVDERRDLAIIYNRLGDLWQKIAQRQKAVQEEKRKSITGRIIGGLLRNGDYQTYLSKAENYFEKSKKLWEQIAEELCTPEAKRSLAISYNRLGDLSMEEHDLKAAKDFNKKYKDICEELVKEIKTERMMRELYVSYQKYGESLHWSGDAEGAKRYYEKGHAVCEKLAERSESPEIKADLAVSFYRLDSVSETGEYKKKAIEICEELCKKYPEVELYQVYLQIFKQ